MVSSRWNFDFRNYLVSKYKIIIISIDARGTPRNGRKVEKAIYKKFGVVDVQDHTDAIEIISEKFVKIDKSKIGLFGISYGGYLTLNLLNSNSNLLNCGIAGSPVTDFRFYDAAYTEKYMGFPTTLDNYIGYERASIINNFNNIKKPIKLLLNHGSGDDNVHYINSAKLTDKLMKMNIDFTFQVYPDERHGIGSSLSISKYFWKKNIQFLLEKCWNFKNSSFIIAFSTTWLVEAGFSAVVDIFSKNRSKLDVNNRGIMQLRLYKLIEIDYDSLCNKHQCQGSH
ncbi:hypothetical protein A3Q56_07400 [Intoshia linei]|uniref:Peptidase S9 prolyl oligopeptidase catalytic domain-containing protein n=1 Tax=Intoshia linei TaxID=1819745 RepID=A0A177ASB4_9BILA|nr:hypothetical protein A3Q56_07400 [Intoshia linei]